MQLSVSYVLHQRVIALEGAALEGNRYLPGLLLHS